MTADGQLWKIAREIAEQAQSCASELEREIFQLESELARKKAEHGALRLATKRVADFPVKAGANYQCPRCWIENEIRSPLRPIPGTDAEDRFHCEACKSVFTTPFR